MSKEKTERLPLWRVLLGVILTVVATVLLIYGATMLTAKAAISERLVRETINEIDLMKEFGEDATKAINVGVWHLTGSAYTDELKLTPEQLQKRLNMPEIKEFIVRKITEFATIVTDEDAVPKLESKELVPFFGPIQEHMEKVSGAHVTEDQIRAEVEKAIDATEYHISREELDKEGIRIPRIYPGRATVCVIIGALLLASVYFAVWPKFAFGSLLCVCSVVLLCITLGSIGTIVSRFFDVSVVTDFMGDKLLSTWLGNVAALFRHRAILSLLGAVIPAGVAVAYYWDAAHVRRLKSNSGRY